MIAYVMKWDILPDVEKYTNWTASAIQRTLGAPGVVEFRAYRSIAGAQQAVATYEFADMASCAAWLENEDVLNVKAELATVATNVTCEIWGPSPVVPEPIRPGG